MTNLFQPWLLVRGVVALVAAVLAAIGVVVAVRILRRWNLGRTDANQRALERDAELAATVVQASAAFALGGLVLAVLGAHRMHDVVRGAMCAYGVLDASPYGFASLGTAATAALGGVAWIAFHRLDLDVARPVLTPRKFLLLVAIAPLFAIDLAASTAYALDLDLSMVASCCSTTLDGAVATTAGAGGGPRRLAFFLAVGTSTLATIAWVVVARRPARATAIFAALVSAAASFLAWPAIVGYVAPHAYETPHHLCPFCLLRAEGGSIGWPLFAALFVGAAITLSIAIVEPSARLDEATDAARRLERRLARIGAVAFGVASIVMAFPVVRFAWLTGGSTLFQ